MGHLQRYRLVEDVPRTGLARLVDSIRSYFIGPVSTGSPDFERLFSAPPSRSGVIVTEHTALTYSAFWACVNAISTDVASLPLIHYKRDRDGGKTRYTDSKLYRLLHDEPNPEMTAITMRQTLTAHALSWGNGYAEIERDRLQRPLYLWPLTPNRVAPYRDTSGSIAYLVRRADGGETSVPAGDMLHIPGLGFDGIRGYSVVTMARESIGLGLGTERFGSMWFGNGSTFGGVISYAGPRPTELADKSYRESLETRNQGIDNAHKLLALYNGATYTSRGVNPNDAQFLETRVHQLEEMCRWFRMPPHKIQHLARSTNNNIEHQAIEYVTDTLRPWLVRWEQELNRKCISPSERRIQFVEHLVDGVLRGDLSSRYAAYAVGRQWGWLSADDICDRENMNPLPNGQGKIYLVPMNMTPANRIDELITAQIDAKKTPPTAPAAGGGTDPNAVQQHALAMVEAIRAALTEAEQRAETHLTRAVQAEDTAAQLTEADAGLRAELEQEREHERAAALDAAHEVGVLKSLLLEATDREATERAARESAETTARRAQSKHAKATAHVTTAQAAVAAADAARQVSEGHLDQALAQAARAEARAATLEIELAETAVRAGTAAAARDEALAAVTTHEAALLEARTALTATGLERERLDAELAARTVCVAADEARLAALAAVTEQLAAAHTAVEERAAALEAARVHLTERDTALATVTAQLAAAEAERETLIAEIALRRTALEQAEQDAAAALEAARTALTDRDTALAAVTAQLAAAEAERETVTAEIARRRTALEQAEQDAAAQRALVADRDAAATQLRSDVDAELAAADLARTEMAASVATAREAARTQQIAVIGAHRGLIADAMGRMIRRETEKARRHQATPAKLRAWIDDFYALHREVCLDALVPAMRAHVAWTASAEDPTVATEQVVRLHIEESITQLRAVLETDPIEDFPAALERVLTRWELHRADALADRVLQAAVTALGGRA